MMANGPRNQPQAEGSGPVPDAALAAKARGANSNISLKPRDLERTSRNPERFVSDFFRRLDVHDIAFCSWKSNPHAERALTGLTDIDLLAKRSHADRLERLLVEQGFKRLHPARGAGYPGIQDWLGFDPSSAKLVHIHLHYQILTGLPGIKEFRIPWEKLILETRIRHAKYNYLWVTDPNLEIIILLVRSALKYNWLEAFLARISGKYYLRNIFEELDFLKDLVTIQRVERYASELLDEAAGQRLLRTLSSDRAGQIKLARAFRRDVRAMFRRHRRFDGTSMLWRRSKFFLCHLANRLGRRMGLRGPKKQIGRRGVIISVIGADGSGKSSISKDIVDLLSWKLQVRHYYLGEDTDLFVMKNLIRLRQLGARALVSVLGSSKMSAGHGTPSTTIENRRLGLRQRLAQYLVETSFAMERIVIVRDRRRKLKDLLRARTNGAIVVTDRFPQTCVAGFFDGPRYTERDVISGLLPRLAASMEKRLYDGLNSIGLDTVLRLHVTADIALRRKPDHSKEMVRRKVQATSAISFPGARHFDIDSTRPLDDVLHEARSRAWESL